MPNLVALDTNNRLTLNSFSSEEEIVKETSLSAIESKKDKSEPKVKRGIDKKSSSAGSVGGGKKDDAGEKLHDSDRAAESPPCEVSSTTLTDTEKTGKQLKSPGILQSYFIDSLWSLSLDSQQHPAIYWATNAMGSFFSTRQPCLQSKWQTIKEITDVSWRKMFP